MNQSKGGSNLAKGSQNQGQKKTNQAQQLQQVHRVQSLPYLSPEQDSMMFNATAPQNQYSIASPTRIDDDFVDNNFNQSSGYQINSVPNNFQNNNPQIEECVKQNKDTQEIVRKQIDQQSLVLSFILDVLNPFLQESRENCEKYNLAYSNAKDLDQQVDMIEKNSILIFQQNQYIESHISPKLTQIKDLRRQKNMVQLKKQEIILLEQFQSKERVQEYIDQYHDKIICQNINDMLNELNYSDTVCGTIYENEMGKLVIKIQNLTEQQNQIDIELSLI
ncbi:UNKNOWN [Stylonychia lemnae]|uniref:Uncharacterized protein n=1 Tax=Stylonychia lemnae TaxID=5949 RepID=A0A078BB08_STYLE|nr:UNKNOWN [Stylonychia lemnae]|eukprot:CDW90427.1 UNKNOWN [Stylonychia lemnae]